ncbi:MAG: polyprenyl synthetase family protein [Gammaproteobacteria bacterium]|nr:polyprenyl synthetase family protein [Gammaproteobacteria bacterium]MBQ0840816.1 polyprenyl synthetase family protein [Gammaproteobacteria bacterium]
MKQSFDSFLKECRERVERQLEQCLPPRQNDSPLNAALRYTTLDQGKRIRPCLVYAAAHSLGPINSDTDHIASALELIHCYSLIHDDLPAMDDDDLRRGRPTCHIAYDEATAILAGDGLQALAFEQLTQLSHATATTALALVRELAQAAGVAGMVKGQAMDLFATGTRVDLDYLEAMHAHKTGDLIVASISMGAQSSGCAAADTLKNLRAYGRAIGLAFQVKDDILDSEGNTATLGKQAGADQLHNKSTYTSLLGDDGAKTMLAQLYEQALTALGQFDERADHLRSIADFIVSRDH